MALRKDGKPAHMLTDSAPPPTQQAGTQDAAREPAPTKKTGAEGVGGEDAVAVPEMKKSPSGLKRREPSSCAGAPKKKRLAFAIARASMELAHSSSEASVSEEEPYD
ncbi:hypothetical protein PF008_g28519 [Phytophthora fragariae]|uniref:Uncharacterized protein n=1 Tax=Phytophthora fragariae TaxID=53985 RepID=A0A6G0QB35_9STRA|nr:hypothetical protein PF008_g28519 [Phytophthora fragariae]